MHPGPRFLIFAALLSVSVPALADPPEDEQHDNRLISNKFGISLGTYLADFETSVQYGLGRLLGTLVNLEQDLSLQEDQGTFRMDGFWRFKPKHALEFGALIFDREASTTLDARIEFPNEDLVFDAGANVESAFKSGLFRLGYRYSFVNTGRVDTGFVAGFSTYAYDLEVEGDATVDDGMGGETIEFDAFREDLIIPIPTLGLFTHFAFTRKAVFRGEAQFLDVEIGDWDATVIDTRLTLDYYFSKHVGIGGGFAGTDIDVRNNSPDDRFRAAYEYTGIVAYISIVAF